MLCQIEINAQTLTGSISYTQIDSFGQPTTMIMYFDNNKSICISNKGEKSKRKILANGEELNTANPQKAMEQLSRSNKVYTYFFDEEGDIIYKNWKEDSLIIRDINHHDPVIAYQYPIPKINWKVVNLHKKIGTFDCQQAVANFRGRKYIVWFTVQIPLPYGPWKFHGLPGLILEASDDEKKVQYAFKSVEIPLKDAIILDSKPKLGYRVNYKEYYGFLQKSEEEYVRSIISKASARGVVLSMQPGKIFKQEMNNEQ